MSNDCYREIIEKKALAQTQLKQLYSLKTNLKQIKKQSYGFIPDQMIIEENKYSYIIKFKELSDCVELGQGRNFDAVFFGQETKKFQILKHFIIMRFINLAITLSKYGIHLPMLNCHHFILGTDSKQSQNIGYRHVYLANFITEELKHDNEQIKMNKNVPKEIQDSLGSNSAKEIQFNEKMTVFSLGCIICYLHTQNHLIDVDLDNIYNNLLRELLEKCKDTSQGRPTLIELKHKYLLIFITEQILDLGTLEIEAYKIEGFINVFITPDEQITGRLCVMEFFTKLKFVSSFFHKMVTKNQNSQQFSSQKFEGCQRNEFKEFQHYSNIIIYLLVQEELAKLKIDSNKELSQWDQDNTKDEINEFKINYLESYKTILEDIQKIINMKSDPILIQQISKYQGLSNNKIREIFEKLKKTQPQLSSSLFICFESLNKVFIYKHLLECFQPIQNLLIQENAYRRYDIILDNLFNNQENIVNETSIKNIKLKY
ncbi:unnamed protein product [Paramecium octaurelia]|uniref:Kinase domain protein n=1 Tax=Paramecium octaurelia TaxID=43137 RepID=A0A8S1UX78_PAROT|nr:unnamed protein product [Paramecium octaurelia]